MRCSFLFDAQLKSSQLYFKSLLLFYFFKLTSQKHPFFSHLNTPPITHFYSLHREEKAAFTSVCITGHPKQVPTVSVTSWAARTSTAGHVHVWWHWRRSVRAHSCGSAEPGPPLPPRRKDGSIRVFNSTNSVTILWKWHLLGFVQNFTRKDGQGPWAHRAYFLVGQRPL